MRKKSIVVLMAAILFAHWTLTLAGNTPVTEIAKTQDSGKPANADYVLVKIASEKIGETGRKRYAR